MGAALLGRRVRLGLVSVVLVSVVSTFAAVSSASAMASPQYRSRWWCNADDPMPMDDMTEAQMMDEATFYPDMKGPLSRSDCRELTGHLRRAKRFAFQYPTAQDAVAAGFRMIVPYVPGMGAHYMDPARLGVWDPDRPNFLLYGGNGSNAPLVGLMWIVNSGGAPPQGFSGGNDHFHRHEKLCLVGGLIVAEGLSDAQCAAMGGANLDVSGLWMLHAWLVPGWEYRDDVFRPHHPDLGWPPPAP